MKSETLIIEIDGVEAIEVNAVVKLAKNHKSFTVAAYLVDEIIKAIESVDEFQETAQREH